MNQIRKHSFEAVSLLTAAENGLLDVTIVPAINQPDWIIPSRLILDVKDYNERIWTLLWRQQEVAVFHLIPRDAQPTLLLVLEGNTDVHRVALQTAGHLRNKKVRISEVKDTPLPDSYSLTGSGDALKTVDADEKFARWRVPSYLFQCVKIDDEVLLIPDLDKIAHNLVDLDS